MKSYLLILFSFWTVESFAQQEGFVFSVASDQGNLIRYWPNVSNSEELAEVLDNTRSFTISRAQISKGELKFTEIETVSFPRQSNHFKENVQEADLTELKRLLKLSSDEDLDNFLVSKYDPGAFSVFMEMKPEFLLAFGLGILDKNVQKGEFYEYEVVREDKKGNKASWGSTSLFAKEGNMELEKVSMKLDTVMAADSTVRFKWQVEIPDFTAIDFRNLADSVADGMGRLKTYSGASARSGALAVFNRYALNTVNTSFGIYYKVNEEKEWRFWEKQIAGSDNSKAGNFIDVSIPCNTEDFVQAVIVPYDFVLNKGTKSEIASGYAISINSVELIYGVNARDSVNSIVLSWKQLPEKPYYSAIVISKSNDQNEPEQIAIISPRDSSFTDHKIFPAGTIFSYYVQPIFSSGNYMQWDKPATVTHSCTTFSKPAIPYGLKIIEEDHALKLSWDGAEDEAFHSYHVFRGVNPNELNLISGNVNEREFRDSITNLSSRITYYYAVMAMNIMQDTSSHSELASFMISKNEAILSPPVVNFQVVNRELYLSWDNIKQNDVEIEGYILQKDTGSGFKTLHPSVLEGNIFVDKEFSPAVQNNYRVASVSIKGDTSRFSPSTALRKLELPETINPVTEITVANLQSTIRITWPGLISDGNVSGYKVYRRIPEDSEFKQIGSTSLGQFEFEDREIINDKTYVYAVTAVNNLNKESEITEEKTIYRD